MVNIMTMIGLLFMIRTGSLNRFVSLLNDISTFVGYLMQKPSFQNNSGCIYLMSDSHLQLEICTPSDTSAR